MADALTGRTAKKQYALAASAQQSERERIAEEERKVASVEAGQKKLRQGGRGFLAFIEDNMGLATTVGGT